VLPPGELTCIKLATVRAQKQKFLITSRDPERSNLWPQCA